MVQIICNLSRLKYKKMNVLKHLIIINFISLVLVINTVFANSNKIFTEGIKLMKLNKYHESIKTLKKINQTNIYYSLAVLNIGIMYYNLSKSNSNYLSKAIKLYKKYLSNNINLPANKKWVKFEIIKYLGISLTTIHKYEEAYKYLKEYDKFLKLNNYVPDFIFLISYGQILMELKEYDKAIRYFLLADKIRFNDLKVKYCLAQCYINKNELNKAKEYYIAAYNIDKTNPAINVELGLVLNMIYGRKSVIGDKFIIYGLKNKNFFYSKKFKKTYVHIFKALSIDEIYEVYDYHYTKIKAVLYTIYVMYLRNILIGNLIIFLVLVVLLCYFVKKRKVCNALYEKIKGGS